MSYILEALKKAQAERQLGSAPTLHALPLQAAPAAGAPSRRVLAWGVLAVLALAAAGYGAYFWHAAPSRMASAAAPAPGTTAIATPPSAAVIAPVTIATDATRADAPLFAPAPAPAPAPRAVAVASSHAAAIAPPQHALAIAPPPPAQQVARAQPAPAPAAAPSPAPTPPTAPAPAEESLPVLGAMPDAVARVLPQVTLGGYIYSRNPADRLLLVDKVLRHEGEEVAPGLTLEKLLPKAAVMNYRGYRYRIPY